MSEVKLNEEQLAKLLEVLGTEPATNFWAANFWVAVASAVLAWLVYQFSRRQSELEEKRRDADFIFASYKDYAALYEDLLKARNLFEANRDKLRLMDGKAPNLDEVMATEMLISQDDWKAARAIKLFYKSRIELASNRHISERAAFFSIDQMGFDFLTNELFQMDQQIFRQNRKNRIERGDTLSEQDIFGQFDRIYKWYADAKEFKANLVVYGK